MWTCCGASNSRAFVEATSPCLEKTVAMATHALLLGIAVIQIGTASFELRHVSGCLSMLMKRGRNPDGRPPVCPVCKRKMIGMGLGVGVCPDCIRDRWKESQCRVAAIHARSRREFQLPVRPPMTPGGLRCDLCFLRCQMGPDEKGYCGVRTGTAESFRRDGRDRALASYYFDPIPTNCVADWVCPGGTGAGFPKYAHDRGPEAGYYNLAVFFESCNLNCLFCQNASFKRSHIVKPASTWRSVEELARTVTDRTSCICFFGGDPIPQLPYALRAAERAKELNPGRILRICWETNGGAHPAWLKRMARISMETGGCVKVDLKAWHPNIHRALCGFDNSRILRNFALLARWAKLRPDPPLVVASTLLTPGYVGEEDVWHLASFIAGLNPDIPYVLLAFAPQFRMEDFPTTSKAQAEACLDAAQRAGLRYVQLANRHLLS